MSAINSIRGCGRPLLHLAGQSSSKTQLITFSVPSAFPFASESDFPSPHENGFPFWALNRFWNVCVMVIFQGKVNLLLVLINAY